MSDVETELAAALAALASDDDERALEHLVLAWEHGRAEPLIPLVDTLASRVEPRYKALGGKTASARYEAFRATAEQGRQGALASLVALLPRLAHGDLSAAVEMLLERWRPTPRMRALLEQIQLPGYTDLVDELRTAHATPRDTPLSARARSLLAELERQLRTDDAGAELLAQVYADPDADAPRLVYADWATSRGDPRGEFITLQYARRERAPDANAVRRERELLERYAQRWLAPIWNAIRAYSIRFERGFLASVTVEPFAVIAPQPEWSTVVALELAYHEAMPIAAFPALRELRNVTPKLLAQIAAAPTKLVHLGLAPEPTNDDALRMVLRTPHPPHVMPELADGRAFPHVTSLGLYGFPEDWAWLWSTPLARQLVRLEVQMPATGTSAWFEEPLPPQIRELHVRDRGNAVQLVREGAAFPHAVVVCREAPRDAWPQVLDAVPPQTLREVHFVLPRRARQDTVSWLEREARRSHRTLQRFTVDVDPFL